ncbi:type II toxin-antitoxin system RelE/ParE family toxin [Niveispirillum irakense]|uniref:type II toxin-antitoxin system RelE/ParE family toxin n=1 Tax=Niveispirillum irakense TaxID=34011 RepID=UPI00048FB2B4|nr:type II toxin-antitoxin system RelE/ParE family toxin [Niveispirillum irakense]
MQVVLTQQAEADLAAARDWYDSEAPGLGSRFMEEFLNIARQLADNPALYQIVRRDIRRAVFRRFPYSLFFRIRGNVVEIFACLHARRNPTLWKCLPQ